MFQTVNRFNRTALVPRPMRLGTCQQLIRLIVGDLNSVRNARRSDRRGEFDNAPESSGIALCRDLSFLYRLSRSSLTRAV